jgi:hypothetical protein
MLGSKLHRSVAAPLVLGGMLLAWDGLWDHLTGWLWGSSDSAVMMSDSSSGTDPDGRPTTANAGSADSESSSGIDPLGGQ